MVKSESKRIIINTSNLQKGGALQVAASFVQEASKLTSIQFAIVLGTASSKVINPNSFINAGNLTFHKIDIRIFKSVSNFIKYIKALSNIEKQVKPDGVITVFGPSYWRPKASHIVGFARPYLIYEDTYFFQTYKKKWGLKSKIKKKLHQFFLKREATLYWTETKDSQKRLAALLRTPLESIILASNNCSHFFWNNNYEIFYEVPAKNKPRLLFLSSYYEHKGFELIPPILDQLASRNVDVELILTIDSFNFEKLFSNYSNVINLGQVEPRFCPYLYEVSDIVFVPTLLEVFSAVYPEAMYSKKPIITTDLPFAKDLCGNAALYFDPRSSEDAVDKIQQLLNSASLREELVNNGHERLKTFDLPEERFRKVLNAVLGRSAL